MSFTLLSRWFKRQAPRQPIVRARRVQRQLGFELLEGRAMPSFMVPTTFATGLNPTSVAVGDFNGDGKADMAVVNSGLAGSAGILLSNGNGTFQPKVDYAAGAYAYAAVAGDFNGDGMMDLAVVGSGVNILAGHGDGTFSAPVAYASGIANGTSVQVGDFNNDGRKDIGIMGPNFASVLLGNGDGTFQAPLTASVPGNNINLVVGDFNRDGNLDMAASNTVSVGTISILKGHGDGSFEPVQSIYANSAPVYLGSGDFNHDGYTDFVVPNSYAATSMSVIMNNGDGTYAPPVYHSIPQTGWEIEVADFNGDGNDDFAVRGATQYMVQLGKGDGTFYPDTDFSTPTGRFEQGTHGDFNGDGAVDFAYVSTGGATVVMNAADDVSNLAGAVGFGVVVPGSTTAGSSLSMTVSALDAAGNPVAGFRGTVYVTSNDPASPSAIAYTFTAADAGTHSFAGSVRLTTVGDQTVTVSAPFMASTTKTVTVTPAVSRLGVSVPSSASAGDVLNVTVTALDSLGGVGAGYSSSVHFTSTDGLAGLPADYTFTSADAGVHTFAVTLRSAGSKWIGVNEVGGTVNGGASVNVASLAASSFTLSGGAGAIGVARPVTVVARDIYGNQVSGYSGTVHFTSSDPLAVLPANTAITGGAATVNVTFLTVGTQTITATDTANAAITGTVSSDATPPVAALFGVSGYPATVAGAAHTFTVTVRDTIGQVATGYLGTIYFSSSDVQAGLPASYTFTAADAGVHSFSATLKTAGTQSISVRDAFGTLTGNQMGIAVSAAAFASYRMSVPLGTDSQGHMLVTAGDNIAMTVRAVDTFGNTVTDYRGKAKFTSTDVLAGLPTAYNFTAADAGVHVFNVVLKTATAQNIVWSVSVVDASNAATLATMTNFEVINAAAATFTLNVPTNATAGTAFTAKLTITDAYGNKVKNYFGTVHFANTLGIAGLPADYTFNGTDAGTHTFTVTLSTVGTQTISVTDVANPLLKASGVVTVKSGSGGGGGGGSGGGGGGGGGGKTV